MLGFKSSVVFFPSKGADKICDNYYFNAKVVTPETDGTKLRLSQKSPKVGRQVFAIASSVYGEGLEKDCVYNALSKLKKYHSYFLKNENTDLKNLLRNFFKAAATDVAGLEEEFGNIPLKVSCSVVATDSETITIANVGNCRVFRVMGEDIAEVSVEHTQAKKMVDMGIIPVQKLKSHPQRKKLSRYLGINSDAALPDISTLDAHAGETFIMLSSAFCDLIEEEDIINAVREFNEPADIAGTLISCCQNDQVGDITAIVIKVYDGECDEIVDANSEISVKAPSEPSEVKPETAEESQTNQESVFVPVSQDNDDGLFDKEPEDNKQVVEKQETINKKEPVASKQDKKNVETKPKEVLDKTQRKAKTTNKAEAQEVEEEESIWPTVIVFAICIVIVGILIFFGIKMINKAKNILPSPTETPSITNTPIDTVEPTAEPEPTASPTVEPTATPSESPTSSEEPSSTESPTPTATEEPTPSES